MSCPPVRRLVADNRRDFRRVPASSSGWRLIDESSWYVGLLSGGCKYVAHSVRSFGCAVCRQLLLFVPNDETSDPPTNIQAGAGGVGMGGRGGGGFTKGIDRSYVRLVMGEVRVDKGK